MNTTVIPPATPERFVELRAMSAFSFLRGASDPEELVERAALLGHRRLAIADRDGLYGVVRAHRAGKSLGVGVLVGAELRLTGSEDPLRAEPAGACPSHTVGPGQASLPAPVFRLRSGTHGPGPEPVLTLLATDRASYGRLSRLISIGKLRVGKGGFDSGLDDVAAHSAGLLAIHVGAPDALLLSKEREIFGDRLSIAIERTLSPFDRSRIEAAQSASARFGVPLVATGSVCMHERRRKPLQDILSGVRMGVRLEQAGRRLLPNAAGHLKSPKEMLALFASFPEALSRSLELADQCTFRLDELKHEFALEILPGGETAMGYLRKLVEKGASERYPSGIPTEVVTQIAHELSLIETLGFAGYFLTVWDIVRFARSRGILCQGRGSAANSIVCFVLGITAIDPVRMNLLFERFISIERGEPPDIDVDFEHERREEVIQYVYEKYGRDHAAMVANVITYRGRSAAREVGKVFGLAEDQLERLSSLHADFGCGGSDRDGPYQEPQITIRDPAELRAAGIDPEDRTVRQVMRWASEMQGLPRHLGIHSGGILITRDPLVEIVPVENASMEDRTVIEWDKDDLETLGMLKIDLLSLGMLSAVRRTLDLANQVEGRALTLATIPAEDPAVYDMICDADTIGTFQIESRAQMQMLPRLKPRTFYDLVVSVAIIRPGPIQGDMIHPYLRRRDGLEAVEYPHPALEKILGKTYGVPLFQEQVMKMAVAVAGFTGGEADELRRAIGWHSQIHIDRLKERLIAGMLERGIAQDYAERVFKMIQGFGGYGFPESHAASFALIGYASAYLKRYHPEALLAGLLNSQPMGFYSPHTLVEDAERHGVIVRPVSILESQWDSTLEAPDSAAQAEWWRRCEGYGVARHTPWADHVAGKHPGPPMPSPTVRLGFREVRGMNEIQADRIVGVRKEGGARTIAEWVARAEIPRDLARRLAAVGAFARVESRGSIVEGAGLSTSRAEDLSRREALWRVAALGEPGSLLAGIELPPGDVAVPLAPMAPEERLAADYENLGLSLEPHPLAMLRPELRRRGILGYRELEQAPHGTEVRIAGLAITRQRPGTAAGVLFITLEDEDGHMNLVVFKHVFERYRIVAREAPLLIAEGKVQRTGQVINVIAEHLERLQRHAPAPPARHLVYFR